MFLPVEDNKGYKYRNTLIEPVIYIGIEDVLMDFFSYFCVRFRKDIRARHFDVDEINAYNYMHEVKIRRFINKHIIDSNVDFWAKIPFTKFGQLLWTKLIRYKPEILYSGLDAYPNIEIGKIKWCRYRRNIGIKNSTIHRMHRNVDITTIAKHGNIKNILIDDSSDKCEEWVKAGGIAYLYIDNSLVVNQIIENINNRMINSTSLDFLLSWSHEQSCYCW